MRKRKIKRYNGDDDSYVEDYASLGKRASQRDSGANVESVPSPELETKPEPDSVAGVGAKNLALDKGPATSYSRAQTEAMDEARRIKAEIARKKAQQQAKAESSKVEDERTAERRMKLKGEEWAANKIGAGYAKAASAVPKATPAEMERRKQMEKSQALETVAPEMNLIGGPSLRAVKAGAEALAAKTAAKEAAARVASKRVEPSLRPMKDITPQPERLGMAPRQIGMKKGGKVSSASSRGDGIAQRGKTRGRVV